MLKPNLFVIVAAGLFIGTGSGKSDTPVTQWPTNAGGNGHYYQALVATNGITWGNAQAIAESKGGYLATITSAEENAFAFSLASGDTNYWIQLQFESTTNAYGPWLGGIQPAGSPEPDGNWTWVTGEPFIYTNWGPGRPNNADDNEDRLQFFGFETNEGPMWNDLHQDNVGFVRSYLIEYEEDPTLKSEQTISFDPIPDRPMGTIFELTATASSGLPVEFAVLSGAASLSNNTLHVEGEGTIVIRASQSGDTNYHPAIPVDRSFTATNATPQPVILSLDYIDSTNVVVTWSAISNRLYRVQYLPDFAQSNWFDVAPDVTATNGVASTTDNPTNAPERYYRVILLP